MVNENRSISYFVRDGLLKFVRDIGSRPVPATLAEQEKLLLLANMVEVEYEGSDDVLQLSALDIARLALEHFVWTDRDIEAGYRLLDALRLDFSLSSS